MEDWWKHGYGYVKMDDEFVYFTSTGNWSDMGAIFQLNEKKKVISSPTNKYKLISFFILTGLMVVWIIWQLVFKKFDPLIAVPLAFFGYMAYQYLSPEIYQEYKIAYVNISKLEVNPSSAKITFLDFNNQETVQEIPLLNHKGFEFFSKLLTKLEVRID